MAETHLVATDLSCQRGLHLIQVWLLLCHSHHLPLQLFLDYPLALSNSYSLSYSLSYSSDSSYSLALLIDRLSGSIAAHHQILLADKDEFPCPEVSHLQLAVVLFPVLLMLLSIDEVAVVDDHLSLAHLLISRYPPRLEVHIVVSFLSKLQEGLGLSMVSGSFEDSARLSDEDPAFCIDYLPLPVDVDSRAVVEISPLFLSKPVLPVSTFDLEAVETAVFVNSIVSESLVGSHHLLTFVVFFPQSIACLEVLFFCDGIVQLELVGALTGSRAILAESNCSYFGGQSRLHRLVFPHGSGSVGFPICALDLLLFEGDHHRASLAVVAIET